jgi:hypothetical protein
MRLIGVNHLWKTSRSNAKEMDNLVSGLKLGVSGFSGGPRISSRLGRMMTKTLSSMVQAA